MSLSHIPELTHMQARTHTHARTHKHTQAHTIKKLKCSVFEESNHKTFVFNNIPQKTLSQLTKQSVLVSAGFYFCTAHDSFFGLNSSEKLCFSPLAVGCSSVLAAHREEKSLSLLADRWMWYRERDTVEVTDSGEHTWNQPNCGNSHS